MLNDVDLWTIPVDESLKYLDGKFSIVHVDDYVYLKAVDNVSGHVFSYSTGIEGIRGISAMFPLEERRMCLKLDNYALHGCSTARFIYADDRQKVIKEYCKTLHLDQLETVKLMSSNDHEFCQFKLVKDAIKIGIDPGQPDGSKTVKVKCRVKKKKVEVLTMQEVDRSVYDPKTGKCESLPDGKRRALKISKKSKKPRAMTGFEKLIGFKLDHDLQRNAFYRILDHASRGKRIDPNNEFALILAPKNAEVLQGCYSIVVQILLERKLIDNHVFSHHPCLTKNGVKALKLLKKELEK